MYQVTFTFTNLQQKRKTLAFHYDKYTQALAKRNTFKASLIGVGCVVSKVIIETL